MENQISKRHLSKEILFRAKNWPCNYLEKGEKLLKWTDNMDTTDSKMIEHQVIQFVRIQAQYRDQLYTRISARREKNKKEFSPPSS